MGGRRAWKMESELAMLIPCIKSSEDYWCMNQDFVVDDSGKRLGSAYDVNYARHIYSVYENADGYRSINFKTQETAFILERMGRWQGQVLVDLGSGSSEHGLMLANIFDAKAYVAVEPRFHDALRAKLQGFESFIPYSVEKDHMRNFLRRLPDDSVSILASGIDGAIISDDGYIDEVASEIRRVLHPGGVFLSHGSNIHARPFLMESVSYDGINDCDFYFKD